MFVFFKLWTQIKFAIAKQQHKIRHLNSRSTVHQLKRIQNSTNYNSAFHLRWSLVLGMYVLGAQCMQNGSTTINMRILESPQRLKSHVLQKRGKRYTLTHWCNNHGTLQTLLLEHIWMVLEYIYLLSFSKMFVYNNQLDS